MENHFHAGLEELQMSLLLMANHAETAVNQSVQALMRRNTGLAASVRNDDDVIDGLEIEIDEMAVRVLTKAPLATDLRLVAVTMKISQNLERIGDEATKIAKRARDLAQEPALNLVLDLPRLAGMALTMLKEAMGSFVERDSAAARAVIPRDREVDALNREIQDVLVQHMTKQPDAVGRCLRWIVSVKSLERIADHAKNIAEEVVYLCEGEDIRHAKWVPQNKALV